MPLAVPLDDPAAVLDALCGAGDGEVLSVVHLVMPVSVTVRVASLCH